MIGIEPANRRRRLGVAIVVTALVVLVLPGLAEGAPLRAPALATPANASCPSIAPTFSRNDVGVTYSPDGLAIGDVDHDGNPDILTVGSSAIGGDYAVSVLRSDGDGGFPSHQDYPVDPTPYGIVTADFDHDGYDDFAIAHDTLDNVQPLQVGINDGHGGFGLTSYAGSAAAKGVTTGDFNGDGHLDVAATTADGHASVWLGDGNGGFGGHQDFAVGTTPWAIAAGDFNGDGRPDLVTADLGSDTVSVLFRTATGFAPAVTFPVTAPNGVTTGDFNGDGNADIATTSETTGLVTVLLSDGAGGFDLTPGEGVGWRPQSITTGDFNHDGVPDLAVATQQSNQVAVLMGDGNGQFGAPYRFSVGNGPRTVASGDVNHDGLDDLVVGNWDSANVSVLLNTSRPGNTPPVAEPDSYTAPAGGSRHVDAPGVLANDTDADCDPLSASLVSGPAHGTLDLHSDGSFSYTPVADYVGPDEFTYQAHDGLGGTSEATVSLAVTTVHATDDSTTATESGSAQVVDVLANDTAGSGTALTVTAVTQPRYGSVVISGAGTTVTYTPPANFYGPDPFTYTVTDAGGQYDVATVSVTVGPVRGCATASFASGHPAGQIDTETIEGTGDFNGDGHADLYTTGSSNGRAIIEYGDGAGHFPQGSTTDFGGEYSESAGIADFNSDGRLDLVAAGGVQQITDVLLGNASGGLTWGIEIHTARSDTGAAATGDFNGDGTADFILGENDGFGTLNTYLGDGAAGFTELPTLSVPGTWTPVTGDFNGDGKLDLATTQSSGNQVSLMLGDGSGGFGSPVTVTVGAGPSAMVAGDFNGDGNLDLAVTSKIAGTLTVLPGDGAGGLGAPIKLSLGGGAQPQSLTAADFNGDGRTDLASSNLSTNQVLVFLNQGRGGFAPAQVLKTGGTHTSYVASGEFNGDGTADIVATTDAGLVVFDNQCSTPARPVARDDSYVSNEDTPLQVFAPGVLGNDSGADSQTVSALAGPSYGTLDLHPDGSFDYTPAADYNGTDTFTYTVHDGHGGTDTGTVALHVKPVADPPVATDDTATVAQDSGANTVDVLANDTDVDGNTLTITSTTQGGHGSVAITNGGTNLSYTPDAGYHGPDSFTYTVDDGHGGTDTATVSVTVTSLNRPPHAVDDTATTAKNSKAMTIDVLANDTDPDGDLLHVVSATKPAHGSAVVPAGGSSVSYTPARGFSGADSFQYVVSDGHGGTASATVRITVKKPPGHVQVLAYDVGRPDAAAAGPRAWIHRRSQVAALIRTSGASIVGLQDAVRTARDDGRTVHPIADLRRRLPGFGVVGNSASVNAPDLVFFRQATFSLGASGRGSLSKGVAATSACPILARATAQWAVLTERATSRSYFVVDTRLSPDGNPTAGREHPFCGRQREREATKLVQLIRAANHTNAPVIVLGSLNVENSTGGERTLRIIAAEFAPAASLDDNTPTVNRFWDSRRDNDTRRVDYVFGSQALRVTSTRVMNRFYRIGRTRTSPSAHYPVWAAFSTG